MGITWELPSEVPASYCVTRRVCENSSGWFYRVAFATRHIGRTQKRPAATEQKRGKDMKHRLAMVGFGGMAGWHYDLIQRIDDLEVAGIWDIKEERRTYARRQGHPCI